MIKDIVLVRTGSSYNIFLRNGENRSPIRFENCKTSSPFGIERQMFKYIINLEFEDDLYPKIRQIDNYFANFEATHDPKNPVHLEIIKKIKNKQYISCIKNRHESYRKLLRTHFKMKDDKITATITKNNEQVDHTALQIIRTENTNLDPEEIEKNKIHMNVDIEISCLWVTNKTFGMTMVITKCEL